MPPTELKAIQTLKILLHLGFFISGITTVLIGQVLPVLAFRFSLNDLQVGYFFPAQFAGSLTGTFLTNWFGRQNKFLAATFIGCFLMGTGVLMLNAGSFEACLTGFFLNGIGIGLTLPSINMLILELNPQRATSALNILNFFWGLGAIVCSLTVYNLSKSVGLFPVSLFLAVSLFVITLFLLQAPGEIEQKPQHKSENLKDSVIPIWTNPTAWLIAGFNFIHVGFESGVGGWLPTYSERLKDNSFTWWLSPTFLFFFFFVAGRGVAPFFLRFLNENKMLFVSLLTVFGGTLVLLSANDVSMLGIGASIAGFGTSSIFPTNISRFTKIFGASASRRATPFFICGTLGAASTNWLIGFTSNYFNDLHSGMFILLVSSLLLILIQIVVHFRSRL
jgi:fucose permease